MTLKGFHDIPIFLITCPSDGCNFSSSALLYHRAKPALFEHMFIAHQEAMHDQRSPEAIALAMMPDTVDAHSLVKK